MDPYLEPLKITSSVTGPEVFSCLCKHKHFHCDKRIFFFSGYVFIIQFKLTSFPVRNGTNKPFPLTLGRRRKAVIESLAARTSPSPFAPLVNTVTEINRPLSSSSKQRKHIKGRTVIGCFILCMVKENRDEKEAQTKRNNKERVY